MSKQVYRVEVSEGGTIQWYDSETGKLHNESGPAIVYPDGYRAYYIHGELHNESGPAIVRSNGDTEYYLHDKKLTASDFLARNKTSCEEKTIVVDGHTYRLVKAD